jgi:nucleotide-binding universal stress UspA family protein
MAADSVALAQERLAGLQQKRAHAFWAENSHVRSGRPYQEICATAREIGADLIVMTTRGYTGLKRIVLGSTAERVVRFAPCPVLVARPGNRPEGVLRQSTDRELTIRKILVPVDFSECSQVGAVFAARLAAVFDAELALFHAVPPPVPGILDRIGVPVSNWNELSLARARTAMSAFKKFLPDLKCKTEIRTGFAVDEICAASSRPDIDLLVTSTHGRSGFDHALLGSVAEQVVRYAHSPVLVVPSHSSLK